MTKFSFESFAGYAVLFKVGRIFMWKRWFVFSLAFCLSLLFLQLLKPKVQIDLVEVTSNPVISENRPAVRSEYQISVENRALYKDLLAKFQNAVAMNDKETIVSLINFPVEVQVIGKNNKPPFKEIKNEAAFLRNYDKIFDNSFKQCVFQINPNNLLFSSSGEVFVFPATAGLRMKRFPKNEGTGFDVKIINLYRCYQ